MQTLRNSPTVNLSNLLTVVRIFLAIGVILLLPQPGLRDQLLAGGLFTLGAVTDVLDGRLARKYNWITNFGKIVDPIADKLLTLGAFTTLSLLGLFPLWILIPIFIRELLITVLRFYFLYLGTAVAAVKSGKQKTTLQIASITAAYVNYLFQQHVATPPVSPTLNSIGLALNAVMYILLLAALYQTLVSGFEFLRNNWALLTGRAAG